MKDIQLVKNFELDKTTPTIIYEANHKDKNLDINYKDSKKQVTDNNIQLTQQLYLIPDSTILEIFIINVIKLSIKYLQLDFFSTNS